MSVSWMNRSEVERDRIARAFARLHVADMIVEDVSERGAPGPSMGEIYAFVAEGARRPENLSQALLRDRRLRANFDLLLRRFSLARIPAAAAAASGESLTRMGEGFSVRIVPSEADAQQVYVIVRIESALLQRANGLMVEWAGEIYREALVDDVDSVWRLVKSMNDPIVRAIRNPDSRIFLV